MSYKARYNLWSECGEPIDALSEGGSSRSYQQNPSLSEVHLGKRNYIWKEMNCLV